MIETQLSAYKILDELGSGGMGKVYLAELTKKAAGLDQGHRVALKVVHPHLLETEGFFKRFMREAHIGQSVQQENVVRTYDCDAVLRDGQQHNFLVMEYVEGQTLRDLLNELGTVPEELCRHIACEMAKALQAIHDAGVVHRDLKPENVLITKDHVIKVMDLGVARLQDEIIRLSQTGAFVGSVHYAAPEQFKGGGEDIDGRSDLHALGVMLYELATARHPFQDDDVKVVLRKILSEEPRRAGELNPQLSPFFEEVVQALMAKERDERFASAAELLLVLEEGEESDWWKERAQALRTETKKPLRRIRVARETDLYGRDEELARLQELYEKAKAGQGQALLIEGEAGIGRTRLVDELVGRLQRQGEDVNFLFGNYPAGGAATAAGAFSTAYREQFGSEGLEDTLRGYLKECPPLIPAFSALLKGHPTPKGEEPLTKDSIQTVFVHATRALATERPTIVLIDDLHFAPEEGRALFASLALAIPEHRVLLIGTSRPGLAEGWVSNLELHDHFARLMLPRLGAKDVAKLVQDVFRSQRLADELGFQIVMKSDGNPFFVFEIIRGLREGKYITQQDDGTWVSTQVIKDIQIPSSVMDLIDSRIADIDEEEREILEIAACCGFSFDPSIVAAAMGLPILPTLKRFARIEKTHRLIRSHGREYHFDHNQVQETLYGGLFEQLREQYHAAIGTALEEQAGAVDAAPEELDGALAVALCEHFFRGRQPKKAQRYVDAALSHLEQGYLNDAAIELADRALAAKGLAGGEARVDLLLRKAGRLSHLGRHADERTALDEALPIAEALDTPLAAARVGIGLGAHLHRISHYAEAYEVLSRALERLRAADGDKQVRARAERLAGNAKLLLSEYDDAQAHYERSIELAREAGAPVDEGGSTNNLAIVLERRGQRDRLQELYEHSLAVLRGTDNRVFEGNVLGNLAGVYTSQGRSEEARTLREKRLEMTRAIGDRTGEASANIDLGVDAVSQGHYDEGYRLYRRALALTKEVGAPRWEADAKLYLGALYGQLGSVERGLECVQHALASGRDTGEPAKEAAALSAQGKLAELKGELDEAERCYEQARALREKLGEPGNIVESLGDLGRCLRLQGRVDGARPHLEDTVTRARALGAVGPGLLALAELACLPDGDPAEALKALAADEARVGATDMTRCRFLLWQATGDRSHLEEAHRLLTFMLDHAPEEFRESMIENVPLHRDIMQAWESSSQGEGGA